MMVKISDAELKMMELIWACEGIKAADLAKQTKEQLEWSRTTTYTQIKRLIEKGALMKKEPQFMCYSLVSKEMVQLQETTNLINKLYNGSRKMFLSTFLAQEQLSEADLDEIRELIEKNR